MWLPFDVAPDGHHVQQADGVSGLVLLVGRVGAHVLVHGDAPDRAVLQKRLVLFASKDTSGRSLESRGRGASRMVCSALGGESRGDREGLKSNGMVTTPEYDCTLDCFSVVFDL